MWLKVGAFSVCEDINDCMRESILQFIDEIITLIKGLPRCKSGGCAVAVDSSDGVRRCVHVISSRARKGVLKRGTLYRGFPPGNQPCTGSDR